MCDRSADRFGVGAYVGTVKCGSVTFSEIKHLIDAIITIMIITSIKYFVQLNNTRTHLLIETSLLSLKRTKSSNNPCQLCLDLAWCKGLIDD